MPNYTATNGLAQRYNPLLDEVYKKASLTSRFDTAEAEWTGVDTVKIYKTSIDGLGDYSRSNGYKNGAVTGTWESFQLTKDRGVSLSIDRFDSEEQMNMAFASTLGQFERVNVAPEVDAYRFAKYASRGHVCATKADIVAGTTDCVGLLDDAELYMGDAEVPAEGRVLYVSEKFYKGLKKNITRHLVNENGVQRNIEMYNDMEVVRVPASRFNSLVTLKDGTSAFGFAPTAGGYPINFMIVAPGTILQPVKGQINKVFTPDENQTADAWLMQYRLVHDAFVPDNKVNGIYVHLASTANS